MTNYFLPFIFALVVSAAVTPLVRRIALAYNIVDKPTSDRKIHKKPIAYLGGIAMFLGFLVPALYYVPLTRRFTALVLGVTILLIVGVVDDIRNLSPWVKLPWQIIASCVVLAGGIGVTTITNPFGGVISLEYGRFAVDWGILHFHITPIGNLLSLLWMVGVINVINFLDGLDGLAGGISGIAAFTMFMLAIKPMIHQPEVALLAIILTGAALGWLPFNFYPAKIFMGDGGAYFLGLTLALLAMYTGGKLATTALVLGFPIFDGVWVAMRRLYRGTSPFKADRQHFHHLLLEVGLTQRQAVLVLYSVASLFGIVAVYSNSFGKLIGLCLLAVLLPAATAVLLARATARKNR